MSKKVVVVYASNKGKAQAVAEKIGEKIHGAKVLNIAETDVADLKGYDYYIFGTSSIGHGDMQKTWKEKIADVAALDFNGKTVALFGLGNQAYHSDTFAEGVSHIYEALNGKVTIEGETSTEGYHFSETKSEVAGKFIGLILDQDAEPEKADVKIDAWLKTLSL